MTFHPDIVLYHANCDDGFGAAWCVHVARENGTITQKPIEFLASNYGLPLPDFDPQGKDILVVDFSLSLAQCEDIVRRGGRILMLDHHATAQDALASLPQLTRPHFATLNWSRFTGPSTDQNWRENVRVEFDMDRSGASMTWNFFFPDADVHSLILAIEDRDLWRFNRPDTALVSLYLRSVPRDFSQWDQLAADIAKDRRGFLREARAMQRFFDMRLAHIVEATGLQTFLGHANVPVTHACPYDIASDACHALLEAYPDAPFVVAAIRSKTGISYSMRSEDHRVNVGALARENGGGGHRNAASFRQPRPEAGF